MNAVFHTSGLVFLIPRCVLTTNTPATFGTVVRKYNTGRDTYSRNTHAVMYKYTHTHTQAVGLQPEPTVLSASQQHHLLTPSKDNKG